MFDRIVYTVIGWDISELNKQATKAEKLKDGPSKEHLDAIKEHMKGSREVREKRRAESGKCTVTT